jgi:signal transduction histidine kinase
MSLTSVRTGWLTGLALVAVLAVNAAGFVGIALARRGARDEGRRAFEAETAARARALETLLASVRADLAFLAASTPVSRVGEKAAASEEAWRRQGAEGALLLFLRGHAEVVRVVVRDASGEPLLQTGRRGGVPLLWVSASPTGLEGAATAPDRPRLATTLALDAGGPEAGRRSLEAEVDPALLLARRDDEVAPVCELLDASGRLLARPAGPRTPPAATATEAAASLAAEGWSVAAPWELRCRPAADPAGSAVEPVSARYRTTLVLNLAVMALAVLLGGFVVQQGRKRERLEAAAREEARVRELERQLFHAERLTTVGRLAAGIAHEINNPLEGMANYLALARGAAAKGDTAALQRHLASVREGHDRVAGIVRQVLAQADPAKAPLVPLDLNQVVRETGQFLESRKDFADIRFDLALAGEELTVRGSPVMLGQVAVNLVLNACEAQPRGGEVSVRTRREDGWAVAEFADRGPGVAEADRTRIFEPFFSTKDSTGLGLSVCHSIVAQHEGELTVLPREGGGAVFRLRLPMVEG